MDTTRCSLFRSAVTGLTLLTIVACAPHDEGNSVPPLTNPPQLVLSWSYGSPAGSILDLDSAGENDVLITADGMLQIVLVGSYTCPRFPNLVTVSGPNSIVVETKLVAIISNPDSDGACSADRSISTSTIAIPDNIDLRGRFSVVVDGLNHNLTLSDTTTYTR